MAERLQKAMARAGIASRRESEEWIRAGRVTVNGKVAVLGSKVDVAKDDVRVDGEPIAAAQPNVYLAFYKPQGVVTSMRAQDDRKTVRDFMPGDQRLYPAGRLDADSEGLVLMMNDGDVAHRLTHPRYEHDKEYRVLLDTKPDPSQLTAWRKGVVLEDGRRTLAAEVILEKPDKDGAWLRIIMREGRKRQIREIAASLGLRVRRLIRVRQGPIHLGALKPGQIRPLSPEETRKLRAIVTRRAPRSQGGARRKARGPGASRRLKEGTMEKRG